MISSHLIVTLTCRIRLRQDTTPSFYGEESYPYFCWSISPQKVPFGKQMLLYLWHFNIPSLSDEVAITCRILGKDDIHMRTRKKGRMVN